MKHLLPLLGVIAFVVGCGADASEGSESTDPGAPPAATSPGAPAPPGAGVPAGTGTPPSGGAQPPPTGTTPGTPGAGAFAGAPAYAAKLGPSTIDLSGKGNGHLSFNAQGNPAGRVCLSCHDGTGKGGAPAFLFAGTLYADKAATKPAVSAEVRMLGADGKGVSAYTDANGNFFFPQGAALAAIPAIAGVRNATVAQTMTTKISDGNCNLCHGAAQRLTL